ncbi:MAG: hypothetical protein AAFR54_02515, partial [Planctomycetota bacterium]
LALAVLAPTALAQTTVTSLLREGQTLPGGITVSSVEGWRANRAGAGYAALLTTEPGARKQIWWDFVDDGTTSPALLFDLAPEVGATVWTAELQDVHEGSVVWNMSWTGASGTTFEAGTYVDGALVFDVFGSGPLPGTTWSGFPVVRRSGLTELHARASLVSGGSAERYLIRVGATVEILLGPAQPLPGTDGRTVEDIVSFELSPDGAHYVAHVRTNVGSDALVVDGARVQVDDVFAESGSPAPPEYVAIDPDVVAVGRPIEYAVTDDADWLGLFEFWTPTSPTPRFAVQSGGLVSDMGVDTKSATLSADGLPVAATAAGPVRVPFQDLVDLGTAADIDGDGSADAGWRVTIVENVATDARERVYFTADATQGFGLVRGVWRVDDAVHGANVCDGVPNSTGRAGRLFLAGSRSAAQQELELVALGLPPGALSLALVSTGPGLNLNPGGSAGILCLHGEIGRYADSIGVADASGGYGTSASLGAIPRPSSEAVGAAGQQWFFQVWHRDVGPAGPTSNFTEAVRVTLR